MIKPMTEPILTVKIAEYVLYKLGIVGNPTNLAKSDLVAGKYYIRIQYICLQTGEKKIKVVLEETYLTHQTEYCNLVLEAHKCPFN
jgi:hypothetical protein